MESGNSSITSVRKSSRRPSSGPCVRSLPWNVNKSKAYRWRLGPMAAIVLQDVERGPTVRPIRYDLTVDDGIVGKRFQCSRDRIKEPFAVTREQSDLADGL